MIGFVCNFYHWRFLDVMQMPAKTFFYMHREGQKMEARQYKELLKIQLLANSDHKYYDYMRERYDRIISPESVKIPELPPATGALKPEEVKTAMRNVFGHIKRGMGYGFR